VLAVLGLLILGQLHARLAYSESADFGALRGIGAVPGQLTATGLARAALIGGAGAVLTVVLAIAVSPAFPVGLAGVAEPHPGVDADWTALLLGAGGVLVATVGVAAWPAWRAAQVRAGGVAGMTPAGRLPAAGTPVYRRSRLLAATRCVSSVPVAMGVGLALQRGAGRTSVPVRSAIAATAVGVVGLSAALGFSASLGYLLATPRLYGVTWDALVTNEVFATSSVPAARSIAADPQVAAWSGTYSGAPLTINGIAVGG